MLAVRERIDEFGDAAIAVVTFADPQRLDAYHRELGLPFPLVADTDRALYRALGVERGTFRQVWSIGTLRMYWRLLRSGRRLRRMSEDRRQLGADVVADRRGVITYLERPPSPDVRPSIDDLLAAVGDVG